MLNALPKTLQDAIVFFSDDDVCIQFVARLRWTDGKPVCPNCAGTEHSFLSTRKIWKCKACKKQFGVKYGTIFEDSPLGLDKWLMAIWMIANCKNGVSSYEIHRAIGVTQKSAWFMLHRIRLAMQAGSIEKLSGTVEADEAFIGGDAKNMHRSKRERFQSRWKRQVKDHKTVVFGMVQRGGKVRAKIVKGARTEEVMPLIQEHIEKNSEVFTDQSSIYRDLYTEYVHDTVNHSIEYVRDNVHTNSIENFWSLLKRTIKGTYVSVAPEHLQAYVEEQSFRYNERKGNDLSRFLGMIKSISGKRLTYQQLIGYQTSH
jgi:transposase-like protein